MATPSPLPDRERERLVALRNIITAITGFEKSSLVRPELGNTLSFQELAYMFDHVSELVSLLSDGAMDRLWSDKIDELAGQIGSLKSLYDDLMGFDPTKEPQQAFQQRQHLINRFRQQFAGFCGALIPVLSYVMLSSSSLGQLVSEAKSKFQEIENAQREGTEVLEKLRMTAGEVGITKYATIFRDEASSHRKHSWIWCTVAIAFVLLILGYIRWEFDPNIRDLMTSEKRPGAGILVPLALSRFVVVSLMYLGVLWSIRNFSAARHNMVVNRHRQNALSTFEAFVKAAEGDAQTKNAVLLQATQSIFAPQPSGYLKADNDLPAGPQVIEIVRGITDKHGS